MVGRRTRSGAVRGAAALAVAALVAGLPAPSAATDTASRPNSAVAIAACPDGQRPVQVNSIVDVGNRRPTLVTSWLPSASTRTNEKRVKDLVRWADRSTVSTSPTSSSAQGHMSKGYASATHTQRGYPDHVVVTRNLLLWFDYTPERPLNDPGNVTPNGGGGQLRGVWALTTDAKGILGFRNVRPTGWAPNQLLAGADGRGVTGSGVSGFITEYIEDNGVTYNVENDTASFLAVNAPLASRAAESDGATLRDEGLLVQAVGRFVDTRPRSDRYVIGSSTASGRISSTTTYRLPACDDLVFIETSWRNESPNRIGPLANIVNAVNHYGEYVADRADANILALAEISPDTCVTRFASADTHMCHAGPEDYRSLGVEHGYRSKTSFLTPPPTMSLRARRTDGVAVNPEVRLHALSGAISNAVIFNTHSASHLIPAYDITYFNRTFWENADPRYASPSYDSLPNGIERTDGRYYFSAARTMTTRYALRFS